MTDPNPNPDPSTDPKDTDPERVKDPDLQDLTDPEGGEDKDPADLSDLGTPEEIRRAVEKYQRRDAALRKAQAEIKALKAAQQKDGDPKDPADDPVAKANAKLVRAETRTALAAAGVTDREDQKAVLDALNLTGIEVDDDGPDADAVEDLVATLRRVFGKASGEPGKPRPRTPRIDTRDRGGSRSTPADPDADRYARILRRR
jgi:hypothetical protein